MRWKTHSAIIVDIFIPDPQFLAYVNPRTGGRGEDLTSDYKDSNEYVKLFFPEGEIDFVASATLTNNPFEIHEVLGRNIYLETPVEIVAKNFGITATEQLHATY